MKAKFLFVFLIIILLITPIGAEQPEIKVTDPNDITEAGTYFIPIRVEDNDGTEHYETVKVTVRYHNTVISEASREGIDARNIRIVKGESIEHDAKELIKRAQAHAWNLDTGDSIPITEVIVSKQTQENFIVTFKTEKETEVSVEASLFSKIVFDNQKGYMFPKNNKTVSQLVIPVVLLIIMLIPIIWIMIASLYIMKNYKTALTLLYRKKT